MRYYTLTAAFLALSALSGGKVELLDGTSSPTDGVCVDCGQPAVPAEAETETDASRDENDPSRES